jgi:hypothetical protein
LGSAGYKRRFVVCSGVAQAMVDRTMIRRRMAHNLTMKVGVSAT